MNHETALTRLSEERQRVESLLNETSAAASSERQSANEGGDMSDPAPSLVAEEENDAIARTLRQRLAAIERAEQRLRDGTYGRSLRSGDVIPDERLEADPAAELTVDEARENE